MRFKSPQCVEGKHAECRNRKCVDTCGHPGLKVSPMGREGEKREIAQTLEKAVTPKKPLRPMSEEQKKRHKKKAGKRKGEPQFASMSEKKRYEMQQEKT